MIEQHSKLTLHKRAAELIQPADVVLDIGCGIRPQQFIIPDYLICLEPYKGYVEILQHNLKDASALIVQLDALAALPAMVDRSVDTIFLLDVVEHMEKSVCRTIIEECLRVARKQIVIYTPLGFMPQSIHAGEKDAWNLDGGVFQEHQSGWTPEDFPGFDSLVCRDLHDVDFRGRVVDPPFGGFYAIKTFDENDHSNAASVVSDQQANSNFFARKAKTNKLAAGIQACQYLTELLISQGDRTPLSELLETVDGWKAGRFKELTAETQAVWELVASKFGGAGSAVGFTERELAIGDAENDLRKRQAWVAEKQTNLAAHESNLNDFDKDVRRREAWVSEKEINLAAHEANVNAFDKDVRRREAWVAEQEINIARQ